MTLHGMVQAVQSKEVCVIIVQSRIVLTTDDLDAVEWVTAECDSIDRKLHFYKRNKSSCSMCSKVATDENNVYFNIATREYFECFNETNAEAHGYADHTW